MRLIEKEDMTKTLTKKLTEGVEWSSFNRFKDITDKYMPDSGEGDTLASQIVTAVNKLVYKWYNDGDVYDNVNSGLSGWANDLSSYANWLYKYCKPAEILKEIYDINSDSEYENLLMDLATSCLNEDFLSSMEKPKQGSIYDCDGPFEFKEDYDDEEDEEYDDEEDEEDEEEDEEEYDEQEKLKEAYSAREYYEAGLERYKKNGIEPDYIKIAAENDDFILSAYKDDEDNAIRLNVITDPDSDVTVYIDQDYKGKVEKAKISWYSIGSVDVERASEFARKINSAVEFAKMIDGKDYSNLFEN